MFELWGTTFRFLVYFLQIYPLIVAYSVRDLLVRFWKHLGVEHRWLLNAFFHPSQTIDWWCKSFLCNVFLLLNCACVLQLHFPCVFVKHFFIVNKNFGWFITWILISYQNKRWHQHQQSGLICELLTLTNNLFVFLFAYAICYEPYHSSESETGRR